MNYGLDRLVNYEENENFLALESFKTMKITWDNVDKISREYTDKIDVESNLQKMVSIEMEYIEKLNEIYTMIENDKFSVVDRIVRKYIPTILTVIGGTLGALGISKLEANGDDGVKEIMKDLGLVSGGVGIILKIKNSKANHFKEDCLDAINKIKNAVKQDIIINQKFLSVGINTKAEASKCEVKLTKNGIVEIYRRY